MKKYIVTLVLTAFQVAVVAQTVNVHFKNGQTIEYSSDNIDYVDFSPKASEPTLTPGQVVDLGLSVYWASCNLGAESPEEFGNYYAWGETSPKSKFTQDNYTYFNTSTTQYTDIGDNIAGTEYDAATVNLGSDWRMPTREEMKDLIDKCTWEWTQIMNVNGYKVTGPNGNSIFIPAAGRYLSTLLYQNKDLDYWTATKSNLANSYILVQNQGYAGSYTIIPSARYGGCTIRPVTTNLNAGNAPANQITSN